MPYEKQVQFNTLRFLKEYEKYPCLWKKKHPDFRNREERELAEKILLPGSELKTIVELKKKIRSLRGTYNFERSKVVKSRTPDAPEGTYKPKLVWYEVADSFLRDNEDPSESETMMGDPLDQITESTSGAERPPSPPLPSPIETPPHHEKARHNKRRKCDAEHDKSTHHSNGGGESPKNEFTTFGHHVASQLQALPLAEAVSLQAEIQCLITSTRLRLLSKAQPQPEYPRVPPNNPPVDMNGFMLPGNEGMHAPNQCFNYNTNY